MTTLRAALEGKRFGLVLSAGYFGFFGHAGFVEALLDEGLRPSAWAGSSAGGMVAALGASGLSGPTLRAAVLERRRDDFWDPDWLGVAVDAVRRGHRPTGLLRGHKFVALLERVLPVQRFDQTTDPLLIVATNLRTQTAQAITTGSLASAVHATCAYPGLFQAVERDGQLLWDGGIVDKAPAVALVDARLRPLDAVLVHYLPSEGAPAIGGPLAYASALSSGFAAVRREHFRLQLELLALRGVQVHVVTSQLPKVGPSTLEREAPLRSRQGPARCGVRSSPLPPRGPASTERRKSRRAASGQIAQAMFFLPPLTCRHSSGDSGLRRSGVGLRSVVVHDGSVAAGELQLRGAAGTTEVAAPDVSQPESEESTSSCSASGTVRSGIPRHPSPGSGRAS